MTALRTTFDAIKEHPLRLLLWMMLVVFAVRPGIESHPIVIALDAVFSLILLGVLRRLVQSAPVFWGSVSLLLLALVARLADRYDDATWLTHAADIISAAFTLLVLVLLLNYVVRAPRVTQNTLLAAICVYVLVGVLFGFIFLLVFRAQPHAFNLDPTLGVPETQLRYFSMITLTTVGYGDIMPKTAESRALAALEALIAQLYLAAIVARLVGIEVAHAARQEDPPTRA
ncbi:MAG: hypothetical protein RLY21_1572 [Planctomycetota bacterium]|jgi:voltage-gated potassium channel